MADRPDRRWCTVIAAQTLVTLRGYQLKAVAAIEARYAAGIHRLLAVMPTGTGKTVVFSEAIRRRGGRAVVLVHRDELVRQAVEKLGVVDPDATVGVVKAGEDQVGAQVVVASVATLAHPKRLDRLTGPYATVVVDEAHHAVAGTYRTIVDRLVGRETLLLGVTATPGRGDKLALAGVFDEIVYRWSLPEAISSGYLADLRAIQVSADVDLDQVRTQGSGDWSAEALGEALEMAGLPGVAARAWCEHAAGRRGIVFTPTVTLAYAVADALTDAGVAAEGLDGTTPAAVRRAILDRLHTGETAVVVNCGVLTEGFDEPAVDCIVVARPTRSQSLYLQMIGRGTRTHPGKNDCLIIDLVGSTTRHQLVTLAELSGIDPDRLAATTLGDALAADTDDDDAATAPPGTWVADLASKEIDLFRRRPMAWVASGKTWRLAAGAGQIALEPAPDAALRLVRPAETAGGSWNVIDRPRGARPALLASGLSLEWAQVLAEDVIRQRGDAALARTDAPWRAKPASDSQRTCLARWGVAYPRRSPPAKHPT